MTLTATRKYLAQKIKTSFVESHNNHPEYACLYWAQCTVNILTSIGFRAIIQAGSASWPRVTKEQDDGKIATHMTFSWNSKTIANELNIAMNYLPEMHVWAAIPNHKEIIDMTTGFWPDNCKSLLSIDWPGTKPPNYFWGTEEELPEDVLYEPDIQAIKLAMTLLKRFP